LYHSAFTNELSADDIVETNARNTLLNTFPNTASLSKVLSTDECTIGAVPITKILWLGYGNSAFSVGVRT